MLIHYIGFYLHYIGFWGFDDKKVLEAYHSGQKTADEIIAFIKSEDGEEKPELECGI